APAVQSQPATSNSSGVEKEKSKVLSGKEHGTAEQKVAQHSTSSTEKTVTEKKDHTAPAAVTSAANAAENSATKTMTDAAKSVIPSAPHVPTSPMPPAAKNVVNPAAVTPPASVSTK